MSATATLRGFPAAASAPTAVAGDDPPRTLSAFRRELAPTPGRAANALRLTLTVLLVVAVCEIFRIPEVSLAAYVVFFISKAEPDASIPQAILGGVAIVVGILVAILYLAATLAEPALRLPLMALLAYATMYLSRASALGFAAYGGGLFMVKVLTEGDNLLKGALGSDQDLDSERLGLPALAFMAPEEALVHNMLWLALAIAVAIALIVAVDALVTRDPERRLREGIARRLDAMAAFCSGDAGAESRVADHARQGVAALAAQNALAGKLKHGRYQPAFGGGVIAAVWELTLVLLAFKRLPSGDDGTPALRAAAPALAAAAAAIRGATAVADAKQAPTPEAGREGSEDTALAMLEDRLAQGLQALRRATHDPAPPVAAGPAGGFFKPDAFSNPGYSRFALKVTLAVMACYLFMNLADWSSIDSCITTCFVVALSSVGQSVHKMLLRVSGALVGAAIGFATILFVMPALTDLGQLLVVMAPVIGVAAWIKCGGERTNYLGQQMAFAFMLVVLQNYGPTLHFETGRDRVIGILVGEVALCTVFLHLWPVSVGDLARKGVAGALTKLAPLVKPSGPSGGSAGSPPDLRPFAEGLGTVRGLLVDEHYDPAVVRSRPLIDPELVARLQALAIPVSMLAASPGDGAAVDAYREEAAAWLDRCSQEILGEHGADAGSLATGLPTPPAPDREGSAGSVWCRVLDAELREALALMQPAARPAG